MSYPVRFIGGPDRLQLKEDGPVYEQGAVIRGMSNQTRLSLQASGVRFAAVHDDDPPAAGDAAAEPEIPPDQVAVNDEIATAQAKKGDK